MSSYPLISVIVPAYNAVRFLPDAAETIHRQGYPRLEIFVVDDGSTDRTAEVAAELLPEAAILSQPNSGPAAARNLALKRATGEFIAFLDADDLWPEGKLELQLARFTREPGLQVVGGRTRYLDLPGAAPMEMRFEGPDNTLSHVHLGSALFRRSAFDIVGLFNPDFHFSEDHDWFLRARELDLPMVILRAVTLLYRRHDANMTRDRAPDELQLTQVFRASLVRRRRQLQHRNLKLWSAYDDSAA